jgi:hypothetical protein
MPPLKKTLRTARGKVSKIGHVWNSGKRFEGIVAVIPKALFYTREAQELVRTHPGLLKNFLLAAKESKKASTVKIGGIELTNITNEFQGSTSTHRFLVKLGGQRYIIKETTRKQIGANFNPEFDAAHNQAEVMRTAEALLRKKPEFESFSVAKPIFALNRKDSMYLATEYYPGFTMEEILKSPELRAKFPFIEHSRPQINRVTAYLQKNGIHDLNDSNILWSPLLKRFMLLDLRRKEGVEKEVRGTNE